MTDSDSKRDGGTLLSRLRRAFNHAEMAVKCYAALIASKTELWGRRGVRMAVWAVLLVVLAATGVVFILSGVAQLLQHWFGDSFPGGGRICVGVGVLLLGLALFRVARSKEES